MPIRAITAWTNRKSPDADSPSKAHLASTRRSEDPHYREQAAFTCASKVARRALWSLDTDRYGSLILANLCTDCVNVNDVTDVLYASYDDRLAKLAGSDDLQRYIRNLELSRKSYKTLLKLGLDVNPPPATNEYIVNQARKQIAAAKDRTGETQDMLFPKSTVLNIVRSFNETATVTTAPPVARRRDAFYETKQVSGLGTHLPWRDEEALSISTTVVNPGPGVIAAAYGITPDNRTAEVPLDVALMIGRGTGTPWSPQGWSKLTITPHGPFGQTLAVFDLLTVRDTSGVKAIYEPEASDVTPASAVVA